MLTLRVNSKFKKYVFFELEALIFNAYYCQG